LLVVGLRLRGAWRAGAVPAPPVLLTDVTARSGVRFLHRNGSCGRHYYPEALGAGCAMLDYDGDGWLDLFLVQGAPLPGFRASGPLWPALYRNNRDGTFTDVTQAAGLAHEFYGIGVAVGDYDNDGHPDLFVTALGGNHLFHDEGGQFYRDVTRQAGVAGRDLCTSAAWLDYDGEGRLDLFVCRYMDYSVATNRQCHDDRGRSAYCLPDVYEGTPSLLYRNSGDGTFTDVTTRSGIGRATGRALGVVSADFDGDGRPDIFVACDLMPNLLFLNQGGGRFREQAAAAGVSHGDSAVAYAGMGVDCGDYDGDGRPDLVVTNFQNEPVSLFRNNGDGTFTNESYHSGVGAPTLPYVKWGCRLVDLNMDGSPDLFIASGHVDDHHEARGSSPGYPQPCQLLLNDGAGNFTDVSARCGSFFQRRQVARGAAFGDWDNDGAPDVLVTVDNGPAVLLRNDTPRRGNWIRVALQGDRCNRDGLGARVQASAGGRVQTQFVRSGTSYLADHDRRLLFGIGAAPAAEVSVRWPCGSLQRLEVAAGRSVVVRESGCRVRGAG
jgi:hypothetical protein